MKPLVYSAFVLLVMTLVLGCGSHPPRGDERSRVATAVANAAAASSLAHAVLTSSVDNPASGLSSLQYDCIAREAAAYWPGRAYSFEVPPVLEDVIEGPPTGFDAGTGELITGGERVREVADGRLLSLHGRNFGFLKEHNAITFGRRPAPRSSWLSKTTLATAVPYLDVDTPTDVEVRVLVRGVPSNTLSLRVVPARHPKTAPFILAKRVIHKEYELARTIPRVDWKGLLDTTTEHLDPFERKDLVEAAYRMSDCARDLEEQLKVFETELNRHARFLEIHEILLYNSPEIEQMLDTANARMAEALTEPTEVAGRSTRKPGGTRSAQREDQTSPTSQGDESHDG